MGRGLFSFSTGIIFGFAAGVFIDNKKKKKNSGNSKSSD